MTSMETSYGRERRSVSDALPLPGLISFGMFVTLWFIASAGQPQYILPSPGDVVEAFVDMAFVTGELWEALSITLVSLVIGGSLALLVGVPLGMLMGSQRQIEEAFDIYVNALYVAPVSALTPLLIYWLGIDLAPRVATVFIFALPQIVITCFRGARSTPTTYLQVARSFGATRRDIFGKVLVPHEVPFIVTAVRLGLGQAIKGAVLAELLVSTTGLGLLLTGFSQVFDTASLIAVLFVLMGLGILGTSAIARFERALTPWRTPA
jgi:ABC-type nitrate/sulfonate/bicarbonate transport system permease component